MGSMSLVSVMMHSSIGSLLRDERDIDRGLGALPPAAARQRERILPPRDCSEFYRRPRWRGSRISTVLRSALRSRPPSMYSYATAMNGLTAERGRGGKA